MILPDTNKYLRGKTYCPKCGARGELLEAITMVSVGEEWEQETPIICPKCKDGGMPLTIGWLGQVKGDRKEFFDEMIQVIEDKKQLSPEKDEENKK